MGEAQVAFDSHDWDGVIAALEVAGDLDGLNPDQLTLLADALYWNGRLEDSLNAFDKAFSSFVKDSRSADAGRIAALLAYFAFRRQSMAVAGGWLSQAQELLKDEPDSIGQVWLKLLYMGKALFADGDILAAVELGDEAFEVSRHVGSRSGQSLALSFKAIAMIHSGEWREALDLMDQSTGMAMGGDDLRMTSDVYCNTISSCRNLGDYKRAGEWTEEAERWMRSNSVGGYTGACQVHRAELKRLHGSWLEAEDEARRACEELERFHLTDYLGAAHYEIGEIRRRMGDLEAAEAAFEKAYAQGHDAQPGLSLLMMDKGEPQEALESITKAYSWRETDDEHKLIRGPSRARLLPALIEIALMAGDTKLAEQSTAQLDEIATAYESQVWQAAAASSLGGLQLAKGENDDAVGTLSRAWREWQQADLPYEMACTRVRLGEARRATGDENGAMLELKAALTTLRGLGAETEIVRIGELIGDDLVASIAPSETRATRTFMFTDIVTSTDLIGLIGDSSWEDLLKWHDKILRSAIELAGGEVVRHTGDGFFASFADTRTGVKCAVDIQRKLARHRRKSGFAPLVRIGLHRTEATRSHGDYSGGGIHLAARIGDLGAGEEIVISSTTLDDAGPIPFPISEATLVELKGIKQPVDVQKVDWR